MPRSPKMPDYFWPQDSLEARLLRRLSADKPLAPTQTAVVPADVLAQAQAHLHAVGLGADAKHTVEHAQLLADIKDMVARIPQQAACNGFIAAISSAPACAQPPERTRST